jgi:hypothetical protein
MGHSRFDPPSFGWVVAWAVTAALLVIGSLVMSSQQQLTFTFDNASQHAIIELYMSVSTDSDWGSDRLGRSVLETGQRFTVRGLYRGRWDIKFIDEDGDVCINSGVGVQGHEQFTITTDWLIDCEDRTE